MSVKLKNENGITLVALVVTLIVLMLLAGITLTLVLGQNGIIGKAKEAKDVSANEDKATEEGLNNLYNEMIAETDGKQIPTTVATAGNNELSDTDNIQLKDDNGNTITIPAGFHIAYGSPMKQEEGIVIEDKEGNQFVWIPVANISNYTRTDFGEFGSSYTEYSETMPTDEQASVTKYHGYYIGRYEAGDSISTNSKKPRANGDAITNTVTIKNEQELYCWVTRDQAKQLAEGMCTQEKYKATTKLCSSYAWDTAINFIQTTTANYGTDSPQGNYTDTTFNYTDITGITQTKGTGQYILLPTGQTTPVNNIYDMGGNEWEWTTDAFNNSTYPCVYRGGSTDTGHAGRPAGNRSYDTTSSLYDRVGFRVALYL